MARTSSSATRLRHLAPGPGGAIDALAVHRATLTVWQLPPGRTAWTPAQTINVPIQYGTSG